MKKRGILFVIALILVMATISACAKLELYGEPITNRKITPIGYILTSPEDYEGKTVAVKGEIMTECPTGCWVNLRDDSGVIYIDFNPRGFAIPQKVRHKVIVQGKVVLKNNKPMIIGTGVEIK